MFLMQQRKKEIKMAFILKPAFIFLTLTYLFSLPHLLHANNTSTSVLNVTATLHQAHQVLFFKPKTLQLQLSSFALQLHPRDSLFNAQHNDYRSLVHARLARDSARVNSILSKLDKHENLSAPVISGLSTGCGEYFVRIGVGQPPRPFYMVPDTGSDLSWLQCKPCSYCYNQSDPIFDPSTSSSYAPITCHAKQCTKLEISSCKKNQCQYGVRYGDESYSEGGLMTETMSFGNTGSVNRMAMGCGHENHGLFVGAAGILGLGGGPLSFTTQTKATSFSYCFVYRDTNKTSSLDFNSGIPDDSLTSELLKNPNPKMSKFYYVGLTGVSVGGLSVSVPESTFLIDRSGKGGIIVDSGTAVTRLQTEAYNAVRDAFVEMTQHLPRTNTTGLRLLETCYNFSSMNEVTVPTMSFEMSDGRSWMLPVKGYLIPVDLNGTFCFAFAPLPVPLSILGNIQQQGTRVSFDLTKSVVGFSPLKC